MSGGGLAVVAVGGNALIPDPKRPALADQFSAVARSMAGVLDMVADGWNVVLTHGNGPQVGFALRRSELAMSEVPTLPMDYADADTQGVIGYMFQRALDNELQPPRHRPKGRHARDAGRRRRRRSGHVASRPSRSARS